MVVPPLVPGPFPWVPVSLPLGLLWSHSPLFQACPWVPGNGPPWLLNSPLWPLVVAPLWSLAPGFLSLPMWSLVMVPLAPLVPGNDFPVFLHGPWV